MGAAPMQNIGAYGVELKDTFVSCKTLNIQTLEEKEFSLKECDFDYRNSVFKNELKGQYIITSVKFRLTKKDHILQAGMEVMKTHGYNGTSVKDIVDAARVPNGSFYNYFESKEAFAIEALQQAADEAYEASRGKLLSELGN